MVEKTHVVDCSTHACTKYKTEKAYTYIKYCQPHVHACVYTHVFVFVCMYVHVCVYTHVFVFVCMCVCVCVCVCVLCVCVCVCCYHR